ncbi:13E12 repeat family protein [Amycolatopsis sp. OK19-0408]|uniref:13E12 repeat family protein n=1 Tax=Amycolatopsis iheyensis TaxID=2945988 RepID=A0A9X2NKA3_9PSEU|nr:13E12 repeat family protein [Amycolatopsis iheyensis]MCR6490366.1 13E12 repeat family protein [Amycolatopsis iheyensis]
MDNDFARPADAEAFADRISSLLAVVRTAEAEIGSLLMEIEDLGVQKLFGYRSVARLYEQLADVPKGTAQHVVKRARALNSRSTPEGTLVPAVAPATAKVAATGQLSNPMIDTIVAVLTEAPSEHRDDAEQRLLSYATEARYKQVSTFGSQILTQLDPKPSEPEETEPPALRRELSLRRKRSGLWELSGRFDDETGSRTRVLLDLLAEHGPDDARSPRQRDGDAFSDAVDLALDAPDFPTHLPERAHKLTTVALDGGTDEPTARGAGTTASARPHACDSAVITAVVDGNSEPSSPGRLRRLISTSLQRALQLRDQGCAFPSCHRSPRDCRGHHMQLEAEDGPTDLDPVLMCLHHHRLLDRTDWEVRITADGLPELPPAFLNKRRKPRNSNIDQPRPSAA